MAATMTANGELTYISFPIEKTETTADGNVIVYGKATDGSVDTDEQIVDTDFSSKAISDWLATGGNLRVQHNSQRDPAGVGIEVNTGPGGETWVKGLVVEPIAKSLVNCGALRAYSVGIARPEIVRDAIARGGRIIGGEIVEISLVDRPANKNCGIELVKSDKDGHAELSGKIFGDSELITKARKDNEEVVSMAANSVFTPADLAKLLQAREVAEKRETDVTVVEPEPVVEAVEVVAETVVKADKPDDDDGDEDGDNADFAPKGAKNCPSCGTSHDADSKLRRCSSCNKKLPAAKSVGEPLERTPCPGCTKSVKAKSSYCPKCGTSMKAAEKADSPGEGVTGASTVIAPAHREPDGAAVESFEHDAGMSTTPDSSVEMKAMSRFKGIGVDPELGVFHDLTCAAFHPDAVAKHYPGREIIDMDAAPWQQKAVDTVNGGALDEAVKAAQLWNDVIALKAVPVDVVSELRGEAYKMFMDANPGPGTFPTPSELSPGKFNRPLITAGHQAPSPAHAGPNTATVPTSDISAAGFREGFQSAGRAEDSPSNKSGAMAVAAPMPTGNPQRTYYTNGARTAARDAMQSVHDHIAASFPEICPMNQAPAPGSRAVPTPVGKADETVEVTKAEPVVTEVVESVEPVVAAVEKAATVTDLSPVTDMLTKMQQETNGAIAILRQELADERKHVKKLQKMVDALGDLPDPNVAAFKGLAQAAPTMTSGLPAGAQTVAEKAELTQQELMRAMQSQWRNDPDPAQREAAERVLMKMSGLPQFNK